MQLPITTKDKVTNPLQGFGFAFIDEEDKKLKIKKCDGIIEFSNPLDDFKLLDLVDYTAFEVFTHNYEIGGFSVIKYPEYDSTLIYKVGDIVKVTDKGHYLCLKANTKDTTAYPEINTLAWRKVNTDKGEVPKDLQPVWVEGLGANLYNNGSYGNTETAIPAMLTHSFTLRTYCLKATDCDVVIDWGDGNFSTIANGEYDIFNPNEADGEGDFVLSHTYNTPLGEDAKYIIKIYGKNYYGIRNVAGEGNHNLICRVLDEDLPLASNLRNISSMCLKAKYLTTVNIPEYRNPLLHIRNMSSAFSDCINLRTVKGLINLPQLKAAAFTGMFNNDLSLAECEVKLNTNISSMSNIFRYCPNLVFNLSDVLPDSDFISDSITVGNFIQHCMYMKLGDATKVAKRLWNNSNVTWKSFESAFKYCSEEVRAQVPASWGGTASNDIIEKSLKEQILELKAEIESLKK
jgi:hypothetical protein